MPPKLAPNTAAPTLNLAQFPADRRRTRRPIARSTGSGILPPFRVGHPSIFYESFGDALPLVGMVDPMVQSHRELRAALILAGRELRKTPLAPGRRKLLTHLRAVYLDAQRTARACGVSRMPVKAA